jgi:hypothetical protein
MKWVSLNLLAAAALAVLALPISAPIISSAAYASKMDGKGSGCSDRTCRGINAASYGKKNSVKKKPTPN